MPLAPTEEDIQRILDNTDWNRWNNLVHWHLQVPRFTVYDGSHFDDAWQSWIKSGRDLFPEGPLGEQELLKAVAEDAVRPGYKFYPQSVDELKEKCTLAGILSA